MSKPQKGTAPDLSGQSKILFYNEGRTMAVLVKNRAGKHSSAPVDFVSAEAALGWCRKNATMMVYCPVNLQAN